MLSHSPISNSEHRYERLTDFLGWAALCRLGLFWKGHPSELPCSCNMWPCIVEWVLGNALHPYTDPAAELCPGAEQAVCVRRLGRCWAGCPPRTRRSCKIWPWSCAKSAATRCAVGLRHSSQILLPSHTNAHALCKTVSSAGMQEGGPTSLCVGSCTLHGEALAVCHVQIAKRRMISFVKRLHQHISHGWCSFCAGAWRTM